MDNAIAAKSVTINSNERSINDQHGSISHEDSAMGDQNMSVSGQDRSTSGQNTSINAQDRSVNVEETTHIQGNHYNNQQSILISKMVLLGLLLPTFDLGTDLLAIYSYLVLKSVGPQLLVIWAGDLPHVIKSGVWVVRIKEKVRADHSKWSPKWDNFHGMESGWGRLVRTRFRKHSNNNRGDFAVYCHGKSGSKVSRSSLIFFKTNGKK